MRGEDGDVDADAYGDEDSGDCDYGLWRSVVFRLVPVSG